jgi:hypothetical protein
LDLDATLPRGFHALHILLGTSSLADGPFLDESNRALALFGAAEIEVSVLGP